MPQYDNPAAFLADPSDFPNQPFTQGMMGAQREEQKAPFLQELLKQQQMNTQKQDTELQEFQSPLAIQQRQAERQKIIDEGDVYNKTKEGTISIANEKARLQPYLTDQHIAEAQSATQLVKHQQASQPLNYFSGLFDILDKTPEDQRKSLYDRLVKESGFPIDKLDPDIKEYQDTTMGHLAAARYAQVHTAEQEQKLAQEQVPAQAQRDVAAMNVGGRLKEAKMMIDAGRFENSDRLIVSLEKSLNNGKDSETGRPLTPQETQQTQATLRRLRAGKLMDFVTKQPSVQAAQIPLMANMPGAQENYNKAFQEAKAQGMQMMGLSEKDFGGGAPQATGLKVGAAVNVGGKSYKIEKIDPDGSAYVNVNGVLKKIKPKS